MSKLDSLFAIEFGQMLENHLFGSQNREKELEIILSSLGLKSKNQLAQIFAGYDTPTTASIFELMRTLNSAEFNQRFFMLKTVNIGVQNVNVATTQTNTNLSEVSDEPSFSGQITGWDGENSSAMRFDRVSVTDTVTNCDADVDLSFFEFDDN